MKQIVKVAALLLAAVLCLAGCGGTEKEQGVVTLTNVSYDPTREFYTAYNQTFIEEQAKKGVQVELVQSHGGSGTQAISVSQGLEADVVTLALEADITAIQKAGLIEEGWKDELAGQSAPYTSTIVFLVRSGNPKNIQDWDDLARDDVGVITPNPKTSGGARWNFLAAWAYAENKYANDQQKAQQFLKDIYENVLVLDSGARGSTTSFVENGQGDVLIAWENEAMLTLEQYPEGYQIVTPSVSILCQPSVAVVDGVAGPRGTADLARQYLAGLYEPDAQRLAARYYYRPSDEAILSEYGNVFDLNIQLVTIEHFEGWQQAQQRFFADGGIFDLLYEK